MWGIETGSSRTYVVCILEQYRGRDGAGHTRTKVKAQCSCGNIFHCELRCVIRGNTTSCGCRRKATLRRIKTKHGEFTESGWTKELRAYYAMRKRCTNPNEPGYHNYGGRGIECRISSFAEFLACVGRAPTKGHSVDRIDVNGHYEVGNLRWATASEQARNTRKTLRACINGEERTVQDWCSFFKIPMYQFFNRRRLGWRMEEIFNLEVRG